MQKNRYVVLIVCAYQFLRSGTFLSLNKKVPKEVSLGETLTVKPIGTTSITDIFYPAFKPPSPKAPFRPLSAAGDKSFF